MSGLLPGWLYQFFPLNRPCSPVSLYALQFFIEKWAFERTDTSASVCRLTLCLYFLESHPSFSPGLYMVCCASTQNLLPQTSEALGPLFPPEVTSPLAATSQVADKVVLFPWPCWGAVTQGKRIWHKTWAATVKTVSLFLGSPWLL